MHELFRAMEPADFGKNETVIKYGGQSSDCYFVLAGVVVAKTPMMHTVEVANQAELLTFCSQHYKDIVWEKSPDGV
jgi:signal-transduction protein with cAMP-binding, CBS, and nucleotidyltransferase domain